MANKLTVSRIDGLEIFELETTCKRQGLSRDCCAFYTFKVGPI
jgi:hypothetical protein